MSILILAMIAGAVSVCGQETEAKPVRVGYYENEVFQEGAREGAVKTGYAYEYYRKLSEYTGWRYEYVYGSFSELYQKLLDGDIDMLAGLAKREDREKLIGYPDAVMGKESYYLIKHDTDTSINADPKSISGKKIGVLDSAMVSVLKNYLKEYDIEAEVIHYPDYTQLFNAFDSGDVDILAAESDGAYGRDHAEVLSVFGESDYYLCVNIHRKGLLSELNEAQRLLAAEEPNYLNSLSTKYYPVSVTARAFSSVEKEWIETHRFLRVGYLKNYLPYSDEDDQGQVTGVIKDIIPRILKTLAITDMEVTYNGYDSYDDMIADMETGGIDAAFPVGGGLYYSEENGIYQSSPVVSAPTELVYTGEFDEDTTSHFAVNENNRMQAYYIRTNYPDAEITSYPSIDDCLEAVLSGKVTCTTLNGLRANDILKNHKYSKLSLRQSTQDDDRCFGVEIGNEGLLKLLNRGINVIGSDYAQNLSYRYTSGLYSYTIMDVIFDHIGIFSMVFFIIAGLIISLLVRDSRRTRREIREKERTHQELESKNKELADSKEALSEALASAENANRAKTVFLNNMSHDIRTPMNAIVGFTSLASSHIDNKDLVEDYLGKISVSSQHLLSLINDILDMSRIESGNVTIEEGEVYLPGVIRDLQTIVQPNINTKEQTFVVDSEDVEHEYFISDQLRINQILLNILSNAIKFTPKGGTIRFGIREMSSDTEGMSNLEFRIEDNGIGISEEFQKSIFQAFTREKTSTVSGIQGTGLGMAITKNIVDIMGGSIRLHSVEGQGSEFIVTIPCRILSESRAEPTQKSTVRDFTGMRILLAEDNEMNQIIAENILKEAGFEVDIARDGLITLEKVEQEPAGYYDAVLMDIQMPGMNGYEAAKRIRQLEDREKASVPIVAVTANAFEEDRKIAREAGMNGHLAKPYDVPAMMNMLDELL